MAHRPRIYFAERIQMAGVVGLDADRAHHLFAVLRLGVGAEVSLFNPRDGEYRGVITAINKRSASVEITQLLVGVAAIAARPELTLFFAAVKRDAMDLMVEKCTELGVSRLQPIITDHTVAGRVGLERLRAIALAAAEQSGRLSVPTVAEPLSLAEVLSNDSQPLFACCEAGEARPILAAVAGMGSVASLGIIIGPEGGFSPAEFAEFARLTHVTRVSMGEVILRCDTAAIAAVALVMNSILRSPENS
ncbi:MAG: RsmE family RNA methyltransferase [Candidatus Pacebacteria bacterium]|nr:RsmE family RNA methyltransferase [Candidatus Paceibacterota bacterium]